MLLQFHALKFKIDFFSTVADDLIRGLVHVGPEVVRIGRSFFFTETGDTDLLPHAFEFGRGEDFDQWALVCDHLLADFFKGKRQLIGGGHVVSKDNCKAQEWDQKEDGEHGLIVRQGSVSASLILDNDFLDHYRSWDRVLVEFG